MNPSYFRINLPKPQAIERLCNWDGRAVKETIETSFSNAVSVSLNEAGQWKGSCLYVYENDGWTVFEDLSGGYCAIPAMSWLEFAKKDNLVVAGYNDAILYGEMVVIADGVIQKEFFEDINMPDEKINTGETFEEINSWEDVAEYVDDDSLVFSDNGTVLIF